MLALVGAGRQRWLRVGDAGRAAANHEETNYEPKRVERFGSLRGLVRRDIFIAEDVASSIAAGVPAITSVVTERPKSIETSFEEHARAELAGGAGRGRPARRAGATPVTSAVGAEDGWGCPATGPAS